MAERIEATGLGENRSDEDRNTSAPPSGARNFEIRVQGQLGKDWSDWLEGLEATYLDNGEMILFGNIVDQAALMGILNKLNRLNLALRSLREVERKE